MKVFVNAGSARTQKLLNSACVETSMNTKPYSVLIDGKLNNALYSIGGTANWLDTQTKTIVPYPSIDVLVEKLAHFNQSSRIVRGQQLVSEGLLYGEVIEPLYCYSFISTTMAVNMNKNPKLIGNYYANLMFNYFVQKSAKNTMNAVTAKPSSFSNAEYSIYKQGYLPIMLVDTGHTENDNNQIFFEKLKDTFLASPLRAVAHTLPTANCMTGTKCNQRYETYWVTREACMDYLKANSEYAKKVNMMTITPLDILYHLLYASGYLELEGCSDFLKNMLSTFDTGRTFEIKDESELNMF